jgi:hypothetical protein
MIQKFSYSWTDYISEYSGKCTRQQYKDIIFMYFELVYQRLLTGYSTRLPESLGYLSLKKTKSRTINWKKTNELFGDHNKDNKTKKRIYNRNEHTDGYAIFVVWENTNHVIPRKSFFKFSFNRITKRRIAKQLMITPEIIGNFNT